MSSFSQIIHNSLWAFGPVAHIQTVLKVVKKIISFQLFEISWEHSPNRRNEPVCLLRICGMNLFIYRENLRNEINLQTEFHCAYLLNMWNESVHILRICRMNLFVYREYAEQNCANSENMWNEQKVE